MPRSAWSPNGTSGVVVSAATAPEINTERPRGRHSPSSRLTRLTAGPMAVKSNRSAAPIHLFAHLRGVNATSVTGALIRMVLLFVGSVVGFTALMIGLLGVGLS